jgi:dynein assembly factor with WDR repeat domains 1
MLEFENGGTVTERIIDLQLDGTTDPTDLADCIMSDEPASRPSHCDRLISVLDKMVRMQGIDENTFEVSRVHKAHAMPLTDCAFTKMGEPFVTGSDDRMSRVWATLSGAHIHYLSRHTNAVYCCCFNTPIGTLVATGSPNKSARVWSVEDGRRLHELIGHTQTVAKVRFDHQSAVVATCRLYDVETGRLLQGHERVSCRVVHALLLELFLAHSVVFEIWKAERPDTAVRDSGTMEQNLIIPEGL